MACGTVAEDGFRPLWIVFILLIVWYKKRLLDLWKIIFLFLFLPLENIGFRFLIWFGRFIKEDEGGNCGQISYKLESAKLEKGIQEILD